ncbi:hypothetical protein MNBD_GAMMA04-1167 [hydrothermal vent metagenome]|uniref:DUF3616 domain-containing protein n=1 Tax=hydrothermal vent metagenome TaxID=652676 RepID=A0A3B0W5V1_9ZZZZ
MALILSLLTHSALAEDIERQPCQTLTEPSGVTQLIDGRILVVEDEKKNPIRLLTRERDGSFSVTPLQTSSSRYSDPSGDSDLGTLADLEAVATDNNGFVYAITSHSLTRKGKQSVAREKLVRFKVKDDSVSDVGVVLDLKSAIIQLDKALKKASHVKDVKEGNGLSIEGLSFDSKKQTLLIGLRTPIIDKKAVILVLKNPKAIFEKGALPKFKKKPIYLDLDKGGIRSITFDATLDGYLILSSHEKKGKKFKLWFWDGDKKQSPRRIRLHGKLDLSNAEGITPVLIGGEKKLMFVFDVGSATKRNKGCYAFLPYEQLKVN